MKITVKLQPRSTPRKWRKVEAEIESYRNKVFNLYIGGREVFHGSNGKYGGAIRENTGITYKLLSVGFGRLSAEDFARLLLDFIYFAALHYEVVPLKLAKVIFEAWLEDKRIHRNYAVSYYVRYGRLPSMKKVSKLETNVLPLASMESMTPRALELIGRMSVDAQDILCSILTKDPAHGTISRKRILGALEEHKNIFQSLDIPRVRWAALTIYGDYNFRSIGLDSDRRNLPPQDLSNFWTGLPQSIRARLILGQTPKEISGNTLSRAEAYAWLKERNEMGSMRNPASWLIMSATSGDESYYGEPSIESRELMKTACKVNSVLIARWLIDLKRRGGWRSVTKNRVQHGPAGQVLQGNLLSRIDEIRDEDLINGIKTSVEDAMNSAGERFFRSMMNEIEDPHMILNSWPENWPEPLPEMKPLLTPADLIFQGKSQNHCVGGYITSTQLGDSICVGIDVVEGEDFYSSTVELSRDPNGPHVFQHYGKGNSIPSIECENVLNRWLNKFQKLADCPSQDEDDEMIPF